ncbi:MAG: PIN domain-containing protein [Bacteroidota bacterium]
MKKKYYLETSILFPAFSPEVPNHQKCFDLFRSLREQGEIVCMSMHLYAELYSNLTRFPKVGKIPPKVAATLIKSLRREELVSIVDLTVDDYENALDRCAEKGLVSGVIFDALHLQAAIKAEVDYLYTNNLRDFERLWGNNLSIELKSI